MRKMYLEWRVQFQEGGKERFWNFARNDMRSRALSRSVNALCHHAWTSRIGLYVKGLPGNSNLILFSMSGRKILCILILVFFGILPRSILQSWT